MCDIFGYTMDELIGERISLLMPPEEGSPHNSETKVNLMKWREKLGNQPSVMPGQRRDGSVFPVRLTVSETHRDNEHFLWA
ncbi:PAS domain S-box protein [Limnohabitans sp. 2KL-17]|uniref:PAS domain S-box protein n=1 Tax=Limnohabitans sp. 2KL-17 TaxID=1100704 RepID=UPI001E5E9F65|nr:PAS domain S-box protein [Limnohabitans sp. 2KL-17]